MKKNRSPFVPFRGTSEGQGQTLLEVLAALGVGVVVLTAITSVVLSSLSNAQFSKNQNLATQYGQQGMEIVRSIRNNSWSGFYQTYAINTIGATKILCLPKDDVTPNDGSCSSVADLIDGQFKREIRITTKELNSKVEVKTTVSFTDSKGEHKSELISVFTNWQQ